MKSRANYLFADAVEQAIVMDELSGVAIAWAFLEAQHVPKDVILRVLSGKSRRHTDTPSARAISMCRSN
ncbi:hypothetical protein [Duganella sp. BuS-21]|uniref:hypothetical protein n=1 Tax=Duganella sp. BuS-21 TaxID=2943848 RepID=UPI0035A59AF9